MIKRPIWRLGHLLFRPQFLPSACIPVYASRLEAGNKQERLINSYQLETAAGRGAGKQKSRYRAEISREYQKDPGRFE